MVDEKSSYFDQMRVGMATLVMMAVLGRDASIAYVNEYSNAIVTARGNDRRMLLLLELKQARAIQERWFTREFELSLSDPENRLPAQ